MGKIGRELVRIAEERIIMLAREIDSRNWHPNDPLLRTLEKQLDEARSNLAYKQKMLHEDENG